jgi:hypothetical protein
MYRVYFPLSKIDMPQKIKMITSSCFINYTAIIAKTPEKQANQTGKSKDEADSREVCSAHCQKLAKLPEVPPFVTSVSASSASALTPLLTRASTSASSTSSLASTMLTPVSSTPLMNLSTAFAAESSAVIIKSSLCGVKKKAVYIDFCNSNQVKAECLKYIKSAADLPNDQQSQISFLVRKFLSSDISIAAFSMLIGKVVGAAPIAFFPLPTKKEDLIQQFLCLIYDTKSMMINTEEECHRYVRAKYSYSEYFADYFCCLKYNEHLHPKLNNHIRRNQYSTWELNGGLALYSKFVKNTTIIPKKLQINTDIYTTYAYL